MRIERDRVGVLKVTAHASELATLASAARWALEGSPGTLPQEARARLRQVLAGYDAALAHTAPPAASEPAAPSR